MHAVPVSFIVSIATLAVREKLFFTAANHLQTVPMEIPDELNLQQSQFVFHLESSLTPVD